MNTPTIEIKPYRKKWYLFCGKSRLSRGFTSRETAQGELDQKGELYRYWAGSAGVSIENTPAVVKAI